MGVSIYIYIYEKKKNYLSITKTAGGGKALAASVCYATSYFKFMKTNTHEKTEMEAERDYWRNRFETLDKELKAELRDPNGTIWEHAKFQQDKIDNLIAEKSDMEAALDVMNREALKTIFESRLPNAKQLNRWSRLHWENPTAAAKIDSKLSICLAQEIRSIADVIESKILSA